jgi:PilS N terminal
MRDILGTIFAYLLGLLGIVVVVGMVYTAFGSNKTQTAITDLTQLATNTQSLYAGQSSFTTATNTVAINGKLAPSDMISGSALTNPWGGTVTLNVNAGTASTFDVTETLVPSDACAKLISSFSSLVGLKINGTAQSLPMDAGTATTNCATAPNTMIFTFGH